MKGKTADDAPNLLGFPADGTFHARLLDQAASDYMYEACRADAFRRDGERSRRLQEAIRFLMGQADSQHACEAAEWLESQMDGACRDLDDLDGRCPRAWLSSPAPPVRREDRDKACRMAALLLAKGSPLTPRSVLTPWTLYDRALLDGTPSHIQELAPESGWHQLARCRMVMFMSCDALVLYGDWQRSPTSAAEAATASLLGMPVYQMEDDGRLLRLEVTRSRSPLTLKVGLQDGPGDSPYPCTRLSTESLEGERGKGGAL